MAVSDRSQVVFVAAGLVVFAAGIAFRSWGVLFGTFDFWADEAWWATLTTHIALTESGIRPIGYMWLSQHLAAFNNPELTLRLPSYLAGIGTMVCVYLAARRLLTLRVLALLALCLVAMNPKLVAFAKEFKPYSLETFVHSGLLLWALICYQRRRIGVAFPAVALAVLPFSYNIVFLYPGLALAMLALSRIWHRVTPLQWAGIASAGLLLLLLVHGFASEALGTSERAQFWGDKYGVFPPADAGVLSVAGWYLRKTWNLVTMAGGTTAVAQVAFGFAFLVGVGALVAARRFVELALLVGPLVFVLLANGLGYWPYGPFRTNIFLFPYFILVACYGLDRLVTHLRAVAIAAAVILFVSMLPLEPQALTMKHARDWAPAPQLTEVLDEMQGRLAADPTPAANVIVAEWHAWRPLEYYLERSPHGRDTYARLRNEATLLQERPLDGVERLAALVAEARCSGAPGATRVWVIVVKLDRFIEIVEHPQITAFGVHQRRFAEHDPLYHPVLIELRVPGDRC
ncbi:MAG: glycosyltransferase family 39 protein [Xanthomonadaceae bacterium]|nr:glycosyltransferase family 39 protein [Xanthomonadaceae bacterium]